MFDAPLDLAAARILITNDDGIDAPGLKRLEKIARRLAKEVWVVAPEIEQSGAGHSLTLRRPLRIRQVTRRRFAVDGTPTDCVLLAVNQIMKECRPDLVFSGINSGGNMGEDMTYSGTIAGAMEATLLGIPAFSFSQYIEGGKGYGEGRVQWTVAEKFAPQVISRAVSVAWPKQVLINVNFPAVAVGAVTGIEITREGRRKIGDEIHKGADPRGVPYYWIGSQRRSKEYGAGTDLEAVRRGAVSVTPLSMDLTHRATMKRLAEAFA